MHAFHVKCHAFFIIFSSTPFIDNNNIPQHGFGYFPKYYHIAHVSTNFHQRVFFLIT
jgi:hypothetical protein